MVNNDQSERLSGQMNASNDRKRLKRVLELEQIGGIVTSLDFYNAAIILQHGHEPIHFLKAYNFSVKAFKLDSTNVNALWLSCAAEDRYLLSVGKAQIWGTQYSIDGNRKSIQEPYNEWVKSDKQKARCGN